MSKPIRGFKINTILDRLAVDVLRILDQCLCATQFDRDRFHLAVLLTLSRRLYVTNLLYRDFRVDRDSQWYSWSLPQGGSARVHEQSIVYLHRVLARRPRLARRLRHEPGNMHLLLGVLCRHGAARYGWPKTEIRRDQALVAQGDAPEFLKPLAFELAAQRARLGESYGEESQRRRGQYGPLWLIRGECTAELPEEMSVFDVVDAVPVPLDGEFAEDAEVQLMLVRVLDALNERYMLLRSCGLDPELWHDRDEPSIARLRELKRLRQDAEELLRLSIESDNIDAYRRAFDAAKGEAKLLGGFADFDEFATSEVGMAILRYAALSLDDIMSTDEGGDEWVRHESIADPDAEDVEESVTRRRHASEWVEMLLDDAPDWFDPVMRHFFVEVLGEGRPIHGGPGDPGVLKDRTFRSLVQADASLAGVDEDELAEVLYQRANALIQRGLRRRSVAGV
jgi:hypothetical protein